MFTFVGEVRGRETRSLYTLTLNLVTSPGTGWNCYGCFSRCCCCCCCCFIFLNFTQRTGTENALLVDIHQTRGSIGLDKLHVLSPRTLEYLGLACPPVAPNITMPGFRRKVASSTPKVSPPAAARRSPPPTVSSTPAPSPYEEYMARRYVCVGMVCVSCSAGLATRIYLDLWHFFVVVVRYIVLCIRRTTIPDLVP